MLTWGNHVYGSLRKNLYSPIYLCRKAMFATFPLSDFIVLQYSSLLTPFI